MSNKYKLKEAFDVEAVHGAFFKGGLVSWTDDGEYFYCENQTAIEKVSIDKSASILTIGASTSADELVEDDEIYTFALSSDGEQIVTSNKSGLIKMWGTSDGVMQKEWKSIHKPISKLVFHKSNTLLASGGCDGTIRIWNLQYYTCTEALRGAQGVITVLAFHPDDKKNIIFAAGDDCKIHGWHVESGLKIMTLHGHFSKITSLSFSEDSKYMVSSGRDSVICLWNIEVGKLEKTIPVYEVVEGAVVLPVDCKIPTGKMTCEKETNNLYVAIAGTKGIIRIFDVFTGSEIFKQNNSLLTTAEENNLLVTQLLYNKKKDALCVVSADHNIIIHNVQTFECEKQLVGYCDEILDIVYFGKEDSHLAVATNSNDIKIYDTRMNCRLLKGHTDLVLSLDKSLANPNLFISGGKDNSVRVWLMDPNTQKINCIAVGALHTASIGSVCLNRTSTDFCFSVSEDQCLKRWKLPELLCASDVNLTCTHTEQAHKKDINCVAISPNDKFIATASQDKTAKLWSAEDLSLLGVFKGHKRGIWSIKFSPADQVVVTTSADCSIKLWCVKELHCLKTIDAHGSSVLRAEFIANGTQIVTAGADGLVKVWSIKTSESMVTLEQHDGRIWALAVSADECNMITGGNDSKLIIWKDVTDTKKEEEQQKQKEIIEQEQKMANLLQTNQFLKALKIAIRLDRPMQVLGIINKVIGSPDKSKLSDTIHGLKSVHKEALFNYAIQWNTNTKNCHAAQQVFNVLLKDLQTDFQPSGLQGMLESAIPYTERHFDRLTQMMQELQFIKYMVNIMEPHAQEQIELMEE